MARNILAVLAGIFISFIISWILRAMTMDMYMLPELDPRLDRETVEQMTRAHVASLTPKQLLAMGSGLLAQSFVAPLVAAGISRHKRMLTGIIAGIIILVAMITFILTIRPPFWFISVMMGGAAILILLGSRLGGGQWSMR